MRDPAIGPVSSALRGLTCSWHGPLAFEAGDALNRADATACVEGAAGHMRLFTPVAPVVTLGRRVHDVAAAGLTETVARCRSAGVTVLRVDRGGQATLHLPGQIVALVALPCARTALAALVAHLLDGVDAAAREHGLAPRRGTGVDAGLWLGEQKLASVGLRHQHGVVRHGVALNVAIDPTLSRALILCGHRGAGYADLTAGVVAPDLVRTAACLIDAWGCVVAPAPR